MPASSPTQALAPSDGSGAMFDRIAARYDLLNRLISLGIDQRWRRLTATALCAPPDGHLLDVAAGTADLTLCLAQHHPQARLVGLDPSAAMLAIGTRKIERAGLGNRITLVEGDAQAMPFADDLFDGATIAFGIRNVPDRLRALCELARVTKPGGKVAILELAEPQAGLWGSLARFHIHTVVPWVGALLSGSREYAYLQRSIAAFPAADQFAVLMREAGLRVLSVQPLTFGVATLFVAEAPPTRPR